jgi:hypothetical protein
MRTGIIGAIVETKLKSESALSRRLKKLRKSGAPAAFPAPKRDEGVASAKTA